MALTGVSASMPAPEVDDRQPKKVKKTFTGSGDIVRPTKNEAQMLANRVEAAVDHT